MRTPIPLLFAAAALLIAGCATLGTRSSRIQEKSGLFATLTLEQKKSIEEGAVEVGYTADMVYMALGPPNSRATKDTPDGKVETWTYRNYFPGGSVTQLSLNNPNQHHHGVQTSSSVPRGGGSIAGTASTGPQMSLSLGDLKSDTVHLVMVDGRVAQMKLESEGK